MKKSSSTHTRLFSFAVPACMDGMIGLAQTALPLVAIRYGATPWFLGMLGWVAQSARLPCTISSGMLSDKVGRTRVIIPASILGVLACVGFALARNNSQLLMFYILLSISIGTFYPSLQAFIGDRSAKDELRKNLSFFNAGWTIGGSVCALVAGYLLAASQSLPFIVAGVLAIMPACFVLVWSRMPSTETGVVADDPEEPVDERGPGPLLPIARMGHFLGFFGFAMARLQFPKLGTELHMGEGIIGLLVGTMLVGQTVGIAISNTGPWWRGKLWPQLLAQSIAVASGVVMFAAHSPIVFGSAFIAQGVSLGIAYTGALYYGLQVRANRGRNTGIHEALVASGNIFGSLAGGAAAQYISLRAPYLVFSGLSLTAIVASVILYRTMNGSRNPGIRTA